MSYFIEGFYNERVKKIFFLIFLLGLGSILGYISASPNPFILLSLIIGPLLLTLVIKKPDVAIYLFILTAPLESSGVITGNITIFKISALIVLIALCIKVLYYKKKIIFDKFLIYLLLFVFISTISIFKAEDKILSFSSLIRLYSMVFIYFAINFLITDYRKLLLLIKFLVIPTAFLAIISIFQDSLGLGLFKQELSGEILRATGTIGDPNYFALIMICIIPFCLLLGDLSKSWVTKIFYYSCFILMVYAIILSSSRGGTIGFLLSFALILIVKKNKLIWVIAIFFIGIFLYNFIPLYYYERLSTLFTFRESSLMQRTDLLLTGLLMFKENPIFGVGIGNFPLISSIMAEGAAYGKGLVAHNLYINILGETGLLGGGVFLIIMIHTYINLKKILYSSFTSKEIKEITLAIFISLTGLLITSLFLTTIYFKYYWIILSFVTIIRKISILAR